jgi:UDP-N-acetylmuramate--alanine ligase
VRGDNVRPCPGGNLFDVSLRDRAGEVRTIADVELPMPGRHNVQNALAAIGVAAELGIPDPVIQRGFAKFGGVKRRFTKVGEVHGAPSSTITATTRSRSPPCFRRPARGAQGRVIAVVQPHRYTRLRDLMDRVPGRLQRRRHRPRRPGLSGRRGADRGRRQRSAGRGAEAARPSAPSVVTDADDVCRQLTRSRRPGDMVICLGAGDITKWAAGLADGISKARKAA